jgi:carboxypeptidase Taq
VFSENVATLRERLGEIADLTSTISLLQWDEEVNMPPKAAPGRGQHLASLSSIRHRFQTARELGELLKELSDVSDLLEPDDAKLVAETLYDYSRAQRLPESFVKEFAETRSAAYVTWVEARKQSNFALFQPQLQRIVDLLKRRADYMGFEGSPYNALLEDYERGMTAEVLKPLFAELAPRQSEIVAHAAKVSASGDYTWMDQDWDEQKQWDFGLRVLHDLGFDLEAGRQDKSVHPFTTNFDLYDVRITTRVNRRDLFSALTGTIHECGHALYEQGFQDKDRRTTLAEGISLGIHESQSRMWENMIGRSLPFWKYYTPILREFFPGQLDGISPEQICAGLNRVEPSLIRVEADECTYNLHIIVRFEVETALIEGNLAVKDVPSFWNEKYKQYLGIDVPDDAHGCLQDIHWSHGAMGYFPTYALGNLYAAQMMEQISIDLSGAWDQVGCGQFTSLLGWLRENVHRHGRRKTAPELIQDISGKALTPESFLRYLTSKYTKA